MLGLQIMYAVAVVGAGLVGAALLLAPVQGARYIWFGEAQTEPAGRLIGAVWFGIGLVALVALHAPAAFVPLLLLQLVYKCVWLLFVAIPALLRGTMDRSRAFFTGLFAAWAIALFFVLRAYGWGM